jgi:hypothetical protein
MLGMPEDRREQWLEPVFIGSGLATFAAPWNAIKKLVAAASEVRPK